MASGERDRWSTGQRWVLGLAAAAQLLLQLDFSIVNIALPSMQRELGFTDAALQWVVTGYAVAFGSLLLLGGRLGDLFGQRRILVTGLVAFAVASLLGGFALSPVMLVVARFVQGAGAALVAPTALAALTGAFTSDRDRARALGIFQAATAGGATAGIVLGGILVQFLGWRSVLLVNPPIIAILLVLVLRHVGRSSRAGERPRLDVLGASLITVALASLVGGMNSGEQRGFASPPTIALLAAAVGLAVAFVVVELRVRSPMLPRALFASRTRTGALVVIALEFAVVVGYVYFISLFLQRVARMSALLTGLSIVPATAVVMLTSILLSRRLLPRLGVRNQLVLGLVCLAAGQVIFAFLGPQSSYVLGVLPGLLVTAFGMGISIPAAAFAANSDVPPGLGGTAGGLFVTAQQAGAAVGLAVLATIAAASSEGGRSLSDGFDVAFLVSAAVALAAAIAALLIVPRRKPTSTAPGPLAPSTS